MERDREKHEASERAFEMQRENVKQMELLMQHRQQRDKEIVELRAFQDSQLQELKKRRSESDQLHEEEKLLIEQQTNISKEYSSLELSSNQRQERTHCPYNMRKIKMLLKQQSDTVRNSLKHDISMLQRISACGYFNEQIALVREKFESQYDLEIQKQTQIEGMYESEAKNLLMKQEQQWNQEAIAREKLLKKFITDQLNGIQDKILCNVQNQRELVEIKESHLRAIDNANQQLKTLMLNNNEDENRLSCSSTNSLRITNCGDHNNHIEKISTNTFMYNNPKFGKKKIAWT